MEVAAAVAMFSRSIDLYKFKYVTVLCDGDSKTVNKLNEINVYDVPVVKEDCINHVAKRMYTGIERIKQKLKGTKDSISGKGKVTEKIQVKLSAYYASALKDNAPDVDAMRNAVYASLMHMISTNAQPHHTFCPKGAASWCHYQRELTGAEVRPHTNDIKGEHGEQLLDLYKALANKDLLQRCTRMMTQNPNESFNGQIWRRCPKTEPSSLKTVQTAVAMAVHAFNAGPQGFALIIQKVGIENVGHNLQTHLSKAAVKVVKKAKRQSTEVVKTRRKRMKLIKAGLVDEQMEMEGALYEAGGFND
jgi:hypothetical protein